ncbi:MAG: hypothetical protein M1837_005598 [Sclerophora amabilis]|nr:MAG: hypothetical protein M1837_005598 [Sclerophora amabilis]
MSVPKPPVALKDPCSVVHDNTLYVLTADAFQSLELSPGSKWKRLPSSVAVKGATCAKATPNGDERQAAMYSVGGLTRSSDQNFSGLQRYIFATQKWETLTLDATVARNRRGHGAAYLNASSSLLIYAGSRDGPNEGLSSETFLISTQSPYGITSLSSKAPPVIDPLLLPWNDTHAAMLGGDPTNKRVFLFSSQSGWSDLGITLERGLPDRSKVQAAIITGDDSSKSLETFDMSRSPNSVTRTVLLNPGGSVARSGKPARRRNLPSSKRHASGPPPAKRRKRDLTVSDWPAYNGSLAPKTTRSGFSLAQGSDDQVVVSGGDDDDPLCIFDTRQNEWVNTAALLQSSRDNDVNSESEPSSSGSTSASASSSASSSSSSSTATSASGATSSTSALPPPPTNPDVRSKSLTILGATLGAIFGLAIILILALLYLRYRRRKRQYYDAGDQRRSSGLGEDKDRMSFADRGASFMSEAGGFLGPSHHHHPPPPARPPHHHHHNPHDSINSNSSVAIMSGRAGSQRRGLFSKGGGNTTGNGLLGMNKSKSPLAEAISLQSPPERAVSFAPVPAPAGAVRSRGDGTGKQRSSGWSRYFSGNSATNLVHMNSGRSANTVQSHSSHGSQTPITSDLRSRESATVAPLRLGGFSSSQDLSRVVSGSPNIEHPSDRGTGVALSNGMSGQIERDDDVSSTNSSRNDAFSSGIPASVHEDNTWTPVAPTDWNGDRAVSSIYTDSARGSTLPSNARESAATMFPQPPQGVPSISGPGGERDKHGHHSDMSWLNLSNTRE